MKKYIWFMIALFIVSLFSACEQNDVIELSTDEFVVLTDDTNYTIERATFEEDSRILYYNADHVLVKQFDQMTIRTLDGEIKETVPDDTVAFGFIEDKFILARYNQSLLVEFPDGTVIETGCHPIGIGIGNEPAVEFAMMDGKLYLRAGKDLLVLENGEFEEIYSEFNWIGLVVKNDEGYAVVNVSKGEDISTYLLHKSSDGFQCISKKSWDGNLICVSLPEPLVLCTSDGLYQLQDDSLIRLTGLVELGLSEKDIYGVSRTEDGFLLVSSKEIYSLKETEKNGATEEHSAEVTVGYLEDYKGLLSIALATFNRSQSMITVHGNAYADITDLVLDIMAGHAPDIICTGSDLHQMELLASRDILYPITDFLTSEFSSDQYFINVLQAGEKDKEIYFFTPFYQIETFAAPTALVGDIERIDTLEEFETAFSAADQQSLYCGMSQMEMLATFISDGLEQYMDYDKLVANFETESFYDVLEYCGRYEADDKPLDLETFRIFMPSYVYSAEYLMTRARVRSEYTPYGPKITYMPMPFSAKQGLGIDGEYYISICAQTEYEWAAKEVLRYLLSEEAQMLSLDDTKGVLPVLRSALPEHDETWPEMMQYESDIIELIERADHFTSGWYAPFQEIVWEEASYYFAGVRTVEETAALIQNRVNLYLQEME